MRAARSESNSAWFSPPGRPSCWRSIRRRLCPDTGRIDFGGGVLKKLADAFCGSPYIQPADWAGTLAELTTIFYVLKNETRDLVGDDALIAAMAARFQTVGGSLEALASTEPIRFLRNAAERNDGHAF